ncbi:MAG: ETC complex I subunit [Paracoccaceae bacterium]|nr:ETC complex I subunit [Paracoccaceae bacterium]MDE2911372.1 ETC complex I subunit [Paracoccaceae bacterium]
MLARIYQPSPSATQSGTARSRCWILEFEPESSSFIDPLMGWTGTADMRNQVRLEFATRKDAIDYARTRGIAFTESNPNRRKPVIRKRGYAENFAVDRRESWTH